MYNYITHLLESIPQYMGEAIVGFVTITIAGLIVGYLSSKYFAHIAEKTRVEGILYEKRIPIYKEIFSRLDNMNQLRTIKHENIAAILSLIDRTGIKVSKRASYQVAGIFTDHAMMREDILALDRYISENRLYYDEEVYKQLLVFQNYIVPYLHFYAIYYEAVTSFTDDEVIIDKAAQLMYTALGVILSEDLGEQVLNTLDVIRVSLNSVDFKRRKMPRYDYSFFNDKNEFIMSHLLKTVVFTRNHEIQELITLFATQAIVADVVETMSADDTKQQDAAE